MKKNIFVVLLLVTLFWVVVGTDIALAYGEEIEGSLTNLLRWITRVLGGLGVGFGIVWTGIRVSMHDDRALSNGMKIILGGILIFSSMKIVDLLKAIFQ